MISNVVSPIQLKETSNFIYKLVLAIGILAMFIVGVVLSIQFMVASAEEKAQVKNALIPYFVGCSIIIGSFSIWSLAINVAQDVSIGTVTYTLVRRCGVCEELTPVDDTSDYSTPCLRCNLNKYDKDSDMCYLCDGCHQVTEIHLGVYKCSGCGKQLLEKNK